MPSDLSISAVSRISGPEAIRERAGGKAEEAASAAAMPAAPAPIAPNPNLRLEGGLGMLVIEFRDRYGEVANTVPSPRELASYQTASRMGDVAALPGHSAKSAPAPEDKPGESAVRASAPGPTNDTATVFPTPTEAIPTASVPSTTPSIPQQGKI